VRAANLGVPGFTTGDLLDRLHRDDRACRAVAEADIIIIVIIGANDLADAWNRDGCDSSCYQPLVDGMGARLESILQLIRSLRAGRPTTVLVDTYWNVFPDGDVALAGGGQEQVIWSKYVTHAANLAIARAADASGDLVVDLVRPLKNGGDDDPTPLLADDGDHPNAAGVQAIVTANVAAARAWAWSQSARGLLP